MDPRPDASLYAHPPSGYVPRIEPQKKHLDFVIGHPNLPWIMIDIHHVDLLLKKGFCASDFTPYSKVITSTCIPDRLLIKYPADIEINLVLDFGPSFHVPFDVPIYEDSPKQERLSFIDDYMENLKEIVPILHTSGIGLIPLVKGIDTDERRICFDGYKELELPIMCYYGAQYFGRGRGSRSKELIEDLRTIIAESNTDYLMVIGAQKKKVLSALPPEVVAAAGKRHLIDAFKHGRTDIDKTREEFQRLVNRHCSELCSGPTVLESFSTPIEVK
ncbi:MAG: hypothetical protein ACXQTE_05830 [Methanosarcinaceae archaeon]